ncbi:hypothetical protein [Microbacterium sp. SORGH_AS_0888]|uniref:hypothetical protein n=1 Tax=Microbacterium sp. SORGH_AS_0888 TaxID=3041791 RepID=UPI0027883DB9|nr:hypothetical protein [Microbacterium sp. SORGH_AS_0888]MDQ1130529.1 hypothetical protein [Microbacterium sp. SORGH_AS_0888]
MSAWADRDGTRRGGPFVVTLVADVAASRPDALEVIAFVSDGTVEHRGTAYPRVGLAPSAWAEVHIPKLADPPPVVIDVCSDASAAVARRAAALLAAGLEGVGWSVREP